MLVVAKFKCESVTKCAGGCGSVKLTAVTGGSKKNESFWKYTPSGMVEMHIDNETALSAFEPGSEYHVTFEPAD